MELLASGLKANIKESCSQKYIRNPVSLTSYTENICNNFKSDN